MQERLVSAHAADRHARPRPKVRNSKIRQIEIQFTVSVGSRGTTGCDRLSDRAPRIVWDAVAQRFPTTAKAMLDAVAARYRLACTDFTKVTLALNIDNNPVRWPRRGSPGDARQGKLQQRGLRAVARCHQGQVLREVPRQKQLVSVRKRGGNAVMRGCPQTCVLDSRSR